MYSNIFYGIVFYCIVVLLCSNIYCCNKRISVSPKPDIVYLTSIVLADHEQNGLFFRTKLNIKA